MYVILRWFLFTALIMFVAWIIPGISVENFISAFVLALLIGFINTFIRPFLALITLPVNFLTLGIFGLVLNALLLMLAGYVTPGVSISGFLPAFLGSILIAFFGSGISQIAKQDN